MGLHSTRHPPVKMSDVPKAPSGAGVANKVIYEGGVSYCANPYKWCNRTKYTITTLHIQKESGVCCQTIDTVQTARIKDMFYTDSCCCCCCGCGNIFITSTDPRTPTIDVYGLPGAKQIYRELRDALDQVTAAAQVELDFSQATSDKVRMNAAGHS